MSKKKKVIIVIIFILSIFTTFAFTYKFHDEIGILKSYVVNIIHGKTGIHKNAELINDLNTLQDENDAWYTKYHFISHSGGGINGKEFSNSLEAWNLAYENGNRVFDADMMFTNDRKLIVKHEGRNLELDSTPMKESHVVIDGNGILQYQYMCTDDISYDNYMNSKIYHKYTPIDCEMLIEYMYTHKDLYIAPDMKDDIEESYNYLYEMAIKKDMSEILDRIIVPVYDVDSYKKVNSIYNFKSYIFKQYINNPQNYYDQVKFMLENNIHVLNVSQDYMSDSEIQEIEKKGIHIYVAVVNNISDMNYYKELGVDGFVSDYLYEADWDIHK